MLNDKMSNDKMLKSKIAGTKVYFNNCPTLS
jgi:hypothetical protein